MRARIEHAKDRFTRHYARNREHPSTECFTENVHIGIDPGPLTRKHFTGTGKPSLDLICDEKYIVFLAQIGRCFQETFRREDNPRLSLDRLDEECCSIW